LQSNGDDEITFIDLSDYELQHETEAAVGFRFV